MMNLQQAKRELLKNGYDFHTDGKGGGYDILRDGRTAGRVYSDAGLITFAQHLPSEIATVVGVPMMGQAEAREAVETIKGHMDSARRLLLDLEEREGWRALGYDSWRACAQAEFGQSQAYLYRQLTAAKIERDLDSPIGEMPESHARALTQAAPADRPRVLDRAAELAGSQPPTAKHIAQAVKETKPPALPDVARFGYTARALPDEWIGLRSPGDLESQHTAAHLTQLIASWDGYPPIPADLATAGVTWRYRIERGYYQVMIGDGIGPTGYTPDEVFETTRDRMRRLGGLPAEAAPPVPAPEPEEWEEPRPSSAEYKKIAATDQRSLEDAEIAITNEAYSYAHQLLGRVKVKTYARDQLRVVLARAVLGRQRERLTHYSASALVSQVDHTLALDQIAALLTLLEIDDPA